MIEHSTSIVIDRPPEDVFDAVADVTRIGEWSPETTGCRWIDGATGPALGARFEGDNEAKVGPVTLKRWTTTSEVTACTPGEVFEFVAADHTTWRYELEPHAAGTRLTESFSHADYEGVQGFVYGTVAQRPRAMVKGMEKTLAHIKAALEGEPAP